MILERISNTLSKENGNSNLVRPLFLTIKCFSKYSFAELCVNTLNCYIEDTCKY